ncbi:glycosyltransferase family 4 protein [Pseudonocardia sp. T1-2H]|uniref:glycosyltransferase family 4 protein n=1 Tax=Pseudonocardia sp. T1-2H TaxID=3128899 RepID=UPI0031018EBB
MPAPRSSGRPSVVHVSSVHAWDDSRIFRRMCLSLARNGYDVTLVAVADTERTVEGVQIVPVERASGRLARLLAVPRVARRARSMRARLYHLHDPELIPMIPVLRRGGARVVYDAHEDLPLQVLEKEYLSSRVRPAVAAGARLLCATADRSADHVLAASPEVADRYRPGGCTVIRNYPERSGNGAPDTDYAAREHRVVYAGGLTRARGVEQMIDAMGHAGLPDDWRLRLAGPHSPDDFLDRLRARPGWDRVEFHGEVPPPEARRLMAGSRIGLAVLQPIGQNVDVLPTKLLEYMSVGIPVVAADYPQCRRIVESAGCGVVVDPTDPRAIGEAVGRLAARPDLAAEMGRRGRAAVAERYSWEAEEKRLLAVYADLLGAAV